MIYGPEGDLLAEAKALHVDLPQDLLQVDLEALGWRVYEDAEIQEMSDEL